MRLGVKHPLVQRDDALVTKEQVVILERFRQPEALHRVLRPWRRLGDVVNGRVAKLRARGGAHVHEHAPAGFAPVGVAGDAVEIVDGFDCFGSI